MVSDDHPVNDPNGTRAVGTSWALQGCLFGAVALFVVLLLTMIYFGYQQFREHTVPAPTVSLFVAGSAHDIPIDALAATPLPTGRARLG